MLILFYEVMCQILAHLRDIENTEYKDIKKSLVYK